MSCRANILQSRVVYGPVVMLVGDRISAERPAPRSARREPSTRVQTLDRDLSI